MLKQKSQELAPGVTRSTDDGGADHILPRETARTYCAIRSAISIPQIGCVVWNSIVWLTSLTSRPRSGCSITSIASTPPPTASAAPKQIDSSIGVMGQISPAAPRAVLVIQCSD